MRFAEKTGGFRRTTSELIWSWRPGIHSISRCRNTKLIRKRRWPRLVALGVRSDRASGLVLEVYGGEECSCHGKWLYICWDTTERSSLENLTGFTTLSDLSTEDLPFVFQARATVTTIEAGCRNNFILLTPRWATSHVLVYLPIYEDGIVTKNNFSIISSMENSFQDKRSETDR